MQKAPILSRRNDVFRRRFAPDSGNKSISLVFGELLKYLLGVFVLTEDGQAQGIPRQQWPQCRQV
jgi:hypothetical protein